MAHLKPTPIERAIAGEPLDRRRRWDERQSQRGFKRVSFWVPVDRVPIIKELKAQLMDDGGFDDLLDFVTCIYRAMLDDPGSDDLDRDYASNQLRRLGVSPAAGSGEDARPSGDLVGLVQP